MVGFSTLLRFEPGAIAVCYVGTVARE